MKWIIGVLAVASLVVFSSGNSHGLQVRLKATAHSAVLSWTEPTLGSGVPAVTSYSIYRGTTAGGEGTTPLASSTTTSYTDATVVAGTTYFYEVAAVNSSGTSGVSNEVSGTVPNPIAPPAPVLSSPVVQ